jgi:hypothetical protein
MKRNRHLKVMDNPNVHPRQAPVQKRMKSWTFQFVAAVLLLLTVCLPLTATSRMERYKQVLRKTAADLNFSEEMKVTGSETGEMYDLSIPHSLASGKKSVTLKLVSYQSEKVKKAFLEIVKVFGKASKEVYGSTPRMTTTNRTLDGIKIVESDSPAHTYKSQVMNVTMPRIRGMTVNITPLISFSVTTMGGPDPRPYMAQLLKNLKEAGLLEPIEEGVSFRLLAEKDGYIPASRVVDTGDISPSSITVSGQVVDAQGDPVQGAKVTIPSLKETGNTDNSGHFRLSVETKGSKPFSTSMTLTLGTPTSGMMISFENPDPLPVPGDATIKIKVRDDKGSPVKAGRVKLKWTVPDFVTTSTTTGKLGKDGTLTVPVQTSMPSGPGAILPEPSSLQVKLEVEVTPDDGGKTGSATLELPLNLSMIIGTTVGPDMKPRAEKTAPQLDRMAKILMAGNWEDGSGKFRVLVHPLHPVSHKAPKEWWLAWSDEDRLPLEFPVTEAPQPGKVIDVGMVDVLTPDEHVTRLRNVAAEFFAAMPLTPSEQSGIQSALRRIVFVDGGVSNVPYFTDNYTNDTGVIHIPGTSKEYWAGNLNIDNDAAYEIIPHELGHFVHHHLVERFSYINMCYNKLSTGTHDTWSTEPGQLPIKLPYISFSENTADFFALLFKKFWETRHPEIKDSPYFKRPGYLSEFEKDEKAMAVVSSMEPGYMVEGVQTRFLRVFYGNVTETRPASVFSDYLNGMLLYMDRPQGWLGGLVNRPARTIYQWVETRQRLPGAFGPADPIALATRYRLIPGAPPAPTATIAYGEKTGRLLLDRKEVDFGRFPVVPVPMGSRLKVTTGTISVDLSDMDTRRTITLKAPVEIVLESRTEIKVLRGLVGADFPVTLTTPGGKVTPLGTVVQVTVNEQGGTEVKTLEGNVRVMSSSGAAKMLKAGQSISMDAAGALGAAGTCNPVETLTELLPKVELPPIPAKRAGGTGTFANWQKRLSSFPWWALVGAVLLIFLVFVALVWLVRRLLAALIIAPLVAAGLLVIGRLILKPTGAKAFSFGTLFVSPWSAWNINADWLPVVAWLVGGLIAGFILRGWFRGFMAGLLVPLVPWILFHLPSGTPMPGDWQTVLALGEQMVKNAGFDLLALMLASGMGGFIGGLLMPAKRLRIPPAGRRQVRRPDPARDDRGWDTDYSHSAEHSGFFDHDSGDDGDDDD